MTIRELVEKAYTNAKEKGFHDETMNIPEKLALIHSEVSEALEEIRGETGWVPHITYTLEGKPLGLAIELADVVIRVADLCGALGLDLSRAIEEKMLYNSRRPRLHGKAF